MNIHLLDLIMYFVCVFLIWRVFLPEEYREELGALIGCFVLAIFTIIYLILFSIYPNWNWIDLFHGLGNYFTSIKLSL